MRLGDSHSNGMMAQIEIGLLPSGERSLESVPGFAELRVYSTFPLRKLSVECGSGLQGPINRWSRKREYDDETAVDHRRFRYLIGIRSSLYIDLCTALYLEHIFLSNKNNPFYFFRWLSICIQTGRS